MQGQQTGARTLVRTGDRARGYLSLSDGTSLVLDRSSELVMGEDGSRNVKVRKGALVAEVVQQEQLPKASFDLPTGRLEVLGTKFSLAVSENRATVEVLRGSVKLKDKEGDSVLVQAGEEGTLTQEGDPVVSIPSSMGDSALWSESESKEEALLVRGVGELRARKPGQQTEQNQVVKLARHDMKVRIAGPLARTEIDETFSNETGDVLEGIYRFPLPPDAQFERLALEVDGKLEEGAFVDRDRAAAIWRGVIHVAAPTTPKPREEIVWVPGPWRDPGGIGDRQRKGFYLRQDHFHHSKQST